MSTELKEILGSYNGILFKEEALSPVFCKPKLIPLKSVTMNKLEEIQRESLIKMKEAIENASCDNETKVCCYFFICHNLKKTFVFCQFY